MYEGVNAKKETLEVGILLLLKLVIYLPIYIYIYVLEIWDIIKKDKI
jgi:hypothetical protein